MPQTYETKGLWVGLWEIFVKRSALSDRQRARKRKEDVHGKRNSKKGRVAKQSYFSYLSFHLLSSSHQSAELS